MRSIVVAVADSTEHKKPPLPYERERRFLACTKGFNPNDLSLRHRYAMPPPSSEGGHRSLNLGTSDLAVEGLSLVLVLGLGVVPGEHGAQLRADGLEVRVRELFLQLLELRGASGLVVHELLGEIN